MAEETTPKKKKSKLPIIAILVMVVAGGGFFVLKGQSKPDKPKVELAEKETDLDEFLTNSADPNVYVRAKLTVRLSKDYDETKFKGNTGDIRDAVINVLNSTQPRDITDSTKRGVLKHALAEAMNTALEGPLVAETPKPDPKDEAPQRAGKRTSEETVEPAKVASAPLDDWDSKTGPVLKVRFLDLATQ